MARQILASDAVATLTTCFRGAIRMNSIATASLCAILLAPLVGCTDRGETSDKPSREPRAAAPLLTEDDARHRSSRISDISYELDFRLGTEEPDFSGEVRMEFELSDTSGELTIDFIGGSVHSVAVNGQSAEPDYNGFFLTVQADALVQGANQVEIAFSHPYSTDGRGLYRFEDPVDGRFYLYTDFQPYDANHLFPCFDQPDLKASFTTAATVPADWTVVSSTSESAVDDLGETRRWHFPESAPISTYIYALHAGDYVSWESAAGDVPLRLFSRASLAEYVRPEDWFVPTQQGFEFFENYFEIPYPFGKYDQIIVPHFNAGAMENLAAVTFSERFLQRGTVSRQARRSLASVIHHELAHMWFGDLVTMDWWNGLWLNESFATFMASLSLGEATEFKESWLSAYRGKTRAYDADERETTHPIEMPTADTATAFANFDAITYNKGSAALKQLNHYVGPEGFRQGVSAYLKEHSYGTSTIDDFLGAIATAAQLDLDAWAEEWLHIPGANTVGVEFACQEDRLESLALIQNAPPEWPALRTHKTQLGLYYFGENGLTTQLVPIIYRGQRTDADIPEATCPDFVYANHGDWDYVRVKVGLDQLSALRDKINVFEDPLSRSMLWQAIWDMVQTGRLSPTEFIDIALENFEAETNDDIAQQVLGGIQGSWSYMQEFIEDEAYLRDLATRLEDFLWNAFLSAEPGSDRQHFLFDRYVGVIEHDTGLDTLADVLGLDSLPEGFVFDQDRRWNVIGKLASHSHAKAAELVAAERANDPSDQGLRRAKTAEVAMADPEETRRLAEMLLNPPEGLSVAEARSISWGLYPRAKEEQRLAMAAEVFPQLQEISDNVNPLYFWPIMGGVLGTPCDSGFLEQLQTAIGESDSLHPILRKRLLNMRFEIQRCLGVGEVLKSEFGG